MDLSFFEALSPPARDRCLAIHANVFQLTSEMYAVIRNDLDPNNPRYDEVIKVLDFLDSNKHIEFINNNDVSQQYKEKLIEVARV